MDNYPSWSIKDIQYTNLFQLQGDKKRVHLKHITILLHIRFLATEFGIAGRTNVEKAQVNEVVDAINDLHTAVVSAILFEKDEKAKEEKKKKLYSETIPSGLVGKLCV